MIKIEMFPACCTGVLMSAFGGYAAVGGVEYDQDGREQPEQVIHRTVSATIQNAAFNGDAFVCVTSNNKQVRLNKILRELGFESTPWMSKKKHVNTKVRIWWYRINGPELC